MVYNYHLYHRLLNIQKLNGAAFEYCNLQVMKDMKKMEERLKQANVQPNEDGTYDLCRELAKKNLIVRSSIALTDDTFKDAPAWVLDIVERYPEVRQKYLVDIRQKPQRKSVVSKKHQGR